MHEETSGFGVDLTGQVALVTGATSGLGRRFAIILARSGAKVAITGRRVERLADLKAEIEGFGGTALPVKLDVTDYDSIKTAIAETAEALGPIDILINNSGMNVEGRAIDFTPESYDQMMDTNLRGAFFMATETAKGMLERGQGGRIINIGSIGSHTVLPYLTVYCMTKSAIAMMTQCLAREWAKYNVNVNALCPGYITTELNEDFFETDAGKKQVAGYPRKRLGVPEDLDGALLLLASPQSRFITGSVFTVDDGQSL